MGKHLLDHLEMAAMKAEVDTVALATLSEVADAIAQGKVSSEAMVEAYLRRIHRIDRSGPTLNSVLALDPNALADFWATILNVSLVAHRA